MAELVNETVGAGWECDLTRLQSLAEWAGDGAFQERWQALRTRNKQRLCDTVRRECQVDFDPDAMLDVQVKRIHEYKRQLLNLLHVIHLYCRIKDGDGGEPAPRCVLLAGKAAPGYAQAKRIIKFANNVAQVVNADPHTRGLLRIAFLPNYRVTSMEVICPAADLSEQISTAGKEASGTGNMKMMMNGAVTIGTRDGANIEILEAVGEDNFFLFGLDADQVAETRRNYRPRDIVDSDGNLRRVLELIASGHFNQFEPGIFDCLTDSVISEHDPWMTAADFASYVAAQERADLAWSDPHGWRQMSIRNCAASGRFSSDRTIREYNEQIWRLRPVDVRAEST
jgi:starch phosphorylase